MSKMYITCDDGSVYEWDYGMGQGPAHVVTEEEQALDNHGLTNPNLDRRIDPQDPTDEIEIAPRDYYLNVSGVESYRTTIRHIHDEESTTDEIP